ncbi:hypothetical protein [Bacteroides fluxus]|uniref:Conserved domain protein n=1 Tax=Bacteroides fluxus YIT 12057 TaxID=763034 RepID=F3PT50_9BACE|nr:hypothetical protein [Bacteroides fluxus]EGF57068.1 conserved domain protein [Bacteroides fluxus YIT 12057]
MKILNILSEGEVFNEEQSQGIKGGSNLLANDNDAWFCSCSGTGDNSNESLGCNCDSDSSIKEQDKDVSIH